ncbi:hypothetical protein GCM10027047_09090 [Rhodococcus aerolatus]
MGEDVGGTRRSRSVAAAQAVGDLHNPFYDDERQRDVWNEASAVGFQVVLWLLLVLATVLVWVGGSTALWALPVLAVAVAGSVVTIAYARAHQVEPTSGVRVSGARLVPLVFLLAALVVGTVRALPGDVPVGSVGAGAVAATVTVAVGTLRRARSAAQDDADGS